MRIAYVIVNGLSTGLGLHNAVMYRLCNNQYWMLTCLYVVNQKQYAEKVNMTSSNATLIWQNCICITLPSMQEVSSTIFAPAMWKVMEASCADVHWTG